MRKMVNRIGQAYSQNFSKHLASLNRSGSEQGRCKFISRFFTLTLTTSWLLSLCLTPMAVQAKSGAITDTKVTQSDNNNIAIDTLDANWESEATATLLTKAEKYRSTDISLSQALLDILQQRDLNKQEHAQYSYLRAYHLILVGEYQQSLREFERLSGNDDVNVRLQALAYILNLHLLERDYQLAVSQLDDILALLPHPDIKPELYTKVLMGIGYFHNQLGAHAKALEYINRVSNRPLKERQQCLLSTDRVNALIGLEQTSPDDLFYHSTLDFCKKIGENIIVEGILADMAHLQVKKANYRWVIETLQPQLASVEASDYPMNIAEFYAHLAVSYYYTGDEEQAWFYGVKAMSYSERFKINPGLHETAKVTAIMAKTRGTPAQAYQYLADQLERQQNNFLQQRAREGIRKHLEFELEKNKQLFAELSDHITKQNSQLRIVNREISTLNNENLISIGYIALSGFVILGLTVSVYGIRRSRNMVLKQLEVDALSKVYHRANLLKHFNSTWQELQSQESHKATLFCLQLDQLSDINYRSGHALTDWLIEKSTEIVCNNTPYGTLIGRYKGSMLVALLPETDMHRLLQLQGRIIEQIDQLNPRVFLTYKFPYHTTSMVMNLAGCKDNIYGILAHCEAQMGAKGELSGHKLIVEDANSQLKDEPENTGSEETSVSDAIESQ